LRFPWDRQVDEANLSAHWFGRMLTALYFSTFMIRASFAIMLIAFPIYIIGLKSYFLFGIVVSSSPIFELITVLALGAYIDKHGRKNVLLVGLLGGSLALFLLLVSKDPVYLFAINAFHGMSAAAILVSSLALIADYAPRESRGKIMGVFDFTNLFGWIVGFGVGGLLIDTFKDNIGMTFVVAGLMGLVAWVWATINVNEPKREGRLTSEISFSAVFSVLKQRSVILLIAPWFIIYLLVSTMLTFTSKAGTQELGLTGRDLAVLLGGGGTIFLATQFLYGWASDKYGRTKIMIVGTVGIVGIMLTVGGVFLTAPLTIAPAAHTALPTQLDGDPALELILQSGAGVYLIDDNGTVMSELAPPEGGFGRVQIAPGLGPTSALVSTNPEAVELIGLDPVAVTWVTPAHEPHAVAAGDIDLDGHPEIFFADRDGLHFSGPHVPASAPAMPALAPGERVVDALFDGPELYVLVHTSWGSGLVTFTTSGPSTTAFFENYSAVLLGDGARAGSVTLVTSGAADLVNASSGAVLEHFAFPEGASFAALRTSSAYLFVAFGPHGGGTFVHERGALGPLDGFVPLPSNLSATHFAVSAGQPTFLGYAPNGTLGTYILARSGDDWTVSSSFATIKVKRETAQATFSKLTSPQLVAPLIIFGLMAGAFGPAALAGLTDVSQSDKRGTTMGLYSVVISSSMIVGPITTGFLVDHYGGFGVMIFLVSSAAAMALFMLLRTLDVRRQGGEEHMLEKQREEREGASKDQAPSGSDSSEE
jgi:DHA1 family multidrug resistance protein-like MFS transporter